MKHNIRKTLIILFIILFTIFLTSCKYDGNPNEYNVYFMLNDEVLKTIKVLENDKIEYYEPTERASDIFEGWYLDPSFEQSYDFESPVQSDITLYANFLSGYYKIAFITGENDEITYSYVYRRTKLEKPDDPTKLNKNFIGWYTEIECITPYDFSKIVNSSFNLYAKWEMDYSKASYVRYVLPEDIFLNKDQLFESFVGEFYYFLLNNTSCDLSDIPTVEDFYTLFKTWEKGGRSDLYHVGDRFQNYFLTFDEDGKPEDQPTSTFIGYLWQQGKYHDFILHLMTFFEYWRTDEGYSQSDPHGNDFFYSSWASLVDTAKFFFFTGNTLQTKYSWFNSKRVKRALDNIPGVVKYYALPSTITEPITLPEINIEGYIFSGYYSDSNYSNQITEITQEQIENSSTIIIYVDLQSDK